MTLETLTAAIRAAALDNPEFSHRVALRVTGLGTILWDGAVTPAVVSNGNDESAEAVIGLDASTLEQVLSGALDPGDAWMDGLFEVEGSTAAALALGQLFIADGPDDGGS